MVEFCMRNGLAWTPPPGDEDGEVSAQVMLEVAAGPRAQGPLPRSAKYGALGSGGLLSTDSTTADMNRHLGS